MKASPGPAIACVTPRRNKIGLLFGLLIAVLIPVLIWGRPDIRFFGRVQDDSGAPLSGVTIKYKVRQSLLPIPFSPYSEMYVQGSATTRADGTFSIYKWRGNYLDLLEFEKEAYRLGGGQRHSFSYANAPQYVHKPDRKTPELFVMILRAKTEKISKAEEEKIRLAWDGRTERFNVATAQRSTGGDLSVVTHRKGPGYAGHFDWDFKLTLDGGELLETKPDSSFLAPESGYKPSWECSYRALDNPWRSSRDATVFYKKGGTYGRLKIRIYADAEGDEVSLYLESYQNESGGRNTEK